VKKVAAGKGRKGRKWQDWSKPWLSTPIKNLNDYEYNVYFKNERDGVENEYVSKYQFDVARTVGNDGVVDEEPNVHIDDMSLIEQSRREAAGLAADDPSPMYSPDNLRELPEDKIRDVASKMDPSYKNAKMIRTGINKYQITEITPEVEGDLPVGEDMVHAERKLDEDLRQYGGVLSSGGLRLLGGTGIGMNRMYKSVD